MCGIAGLWDPQARLAAAERRALCAAMTAALRHRGPDDGGVWVDEAHGVALGHRRLSIVDLSPAGAQPMRSGSGRWVLTYNGEVYGYAALREELAGLGHGFRGHSDTEVLLAAVERWGVEASLGRIRGMFAFALWDAERRELWLARDRAGKKPLYYGWNDGVLLFASELHALRRHPGFDAGIDLAALGAYVEHGWIPHPLSIHRGARKLPPGSLLRVGADDPPGAERPAAWWSARDAAEEAARSPFAGSLDEAVDRLEALLEGAVAERLVADVEVGALLSGGIDSTVVVALAQRRASRPLRTFTIGFREPRHDESGPARAVAARLGTRHEELVVTPEQALAVVPALPSVYDEPFADVSAVPTVLVARLAHERVKVVLSGDGGDELFAGYRHQHEALEAWRRLHRLPRPLRAGAERATARAARLAWRLARPQAPRGLRSVARLARATRGWSAADVTGLLARRFARCAAPSWLVPGAVPAPVPLHDPALRPRGVDDLLALRHFDFAGFLTDDILVKVDRASMAVGLEVRCPLLDTRLVAFAWTLPEALLLDAVGGKRVLRALLHRLVPRELVERPKRGFGAPVGEWLRGPLREWAEDLLAEPRLRRAGLFAPAAVQELWQQHRAGWRNHENLLWALLVFETWREAVA